MPRIEVNGANLYISDQGSANPALVFLHYFAGSSRSWDGVIDRMRSAYRCVAPDLRGFGDSSGPAFHYAVHDYADDVEELIRSLGLESHILVGHSMGGKFAMALAARRPVGLRALVLVDPSPPTPEPMSRSDRKHLLASHGDRSAMVALIQKITVRPLPNRSSILPWTTICAARSRPGARGWNMGAARISPSAWLMSPCQRSSSGVPKTV